MIIVLCPLKSNRAERWEFNESTIRELGYWKDDAVLLDKLDEYKFMPCCKLENKLSKMACNEGHINILKRIVNEDLHDVVICEDDSNIEYDKLNEFMNQDKPDGFIYLGGKFDYPLVKNWDKQRSVEKYMEGKSKDGFNEVNHDFIITGAFGYFIKNKDIALHILNNCKGKTGKYISTLTDLMYARIKGLKKYYYYPSIVEIEYMPSLIGHDNFSVDTTWKNYVSGA